MCIMKECETECKDDSTMDCRMCVRKNKRVGSKCSKAFLSCSGFPKPSLEAALAGQCTSAQDMAKAEGLEQDIPACMQKSQTASGIAACIEADGFTAGCSQCVGTYGACVIEKCGTECEADPTGAACKTCYTDKCEPAFYACSGFPKPSLEAALTGQCTGAQDMAKAAGLEQDIPACMQQSQTSSGIAACIEADGFTAGCSQCV